MSSTSIYGKPICYVEAVHGWRAVVFTANRLVGVVPVVRFALTPKMVGGVLDGMFGDPTASFAPVLDEGLTLLQLVPPGADMAEVMDELQRRGMVAGKEKSTP